MESNIHGQFAPKYLMILGRSEIILFPTHINFKILSTTDMSKISAKCLQYIGDIHQNVKKIWNIVKTGTIDH